MKTDHLFERDRAYNLIVELLFDPAFDKTTALSERGLAEQLGIGRMPVREALRQLEQEGVVVVRPARGTFLRQIGPENLTEIYGVRELLECTAAANAARRDMPEPLRLIGAKLSLMLREPTSFSAAEIDDAGTQFHNLLVEASGNPALCEAIRLFRSRYRMAFHMPRYFANQLVTQTLMEHVGIFEAVRMNDPELAHERMRVHLASGLELRMAITRTLSDPEIIENSNALERQK